MPLTLSSSDYVHQKKVDWPAVIEDLRARGLTITKIAACLGLNRTTVSEWRLNHEPNFASGAALLELHSRYCGEDLTKLRR